MTIALASASATEASIPPPLKPPFLALPVELRIEIYEYVLLSKRPSLAVSLVCRQVHMEAQPTLYRRHATFASQRQLFVWIQQSSQSNLNRVQQLSLTLTDIDLSALLVPERNDDGGPRGVWCVYQRELQQLDDALCSLPNLSNLVITPPPQENRSQLARGMYLSFVALISQRLPNLNQLTIVDTEDVLVKVPSLRNLSQVACTVGKHDSQGSFESKRQTEKHQPNGSSKHGVAKSLAASLGNLDANRNRSSSLKRRRASRVKRRTETDGVLKASARKGMSRTPKS